MALPRRIATLSTGTPARLEYVNGKWYAFYVYDNNVDAVTFYIYSPGSDGDNTWSQVTSHVVSTSVISDAYTDIRTMVNGTEIWILLQYTDASTYRTWKPYVFETTTETLTTNLTSASESTFNSIFNPLFAAAYRSDDTIAIVWQYAFYDKGKYYSRLYARVYDTDTDTWGSEITTGQDGEQNVNYDNSLAGFAEGTSDRLHVLTSAYLATLTNDYRMELNTFLSTDSWGTLVVSDQNGTTGYAHGGSGYYSNARGVLDSSTVYIPYQVYDGTNEYIKVLSFTSADTPSSPTATQISDASDSALANNSVFDAALSALNTVYVFWASSADTGGTILIRKDSKTTSWGTDEVIEHLHINLENGNDNPGAGTSGQYVGLNPKGTRLYRINNTSIEQASLSKAFAVNSYSVGSYSSYNVSSILTSLVDATDMLFNEDGTKAYIACDTAQAVYTINLGTPYDFSGTKTDASEVLDTDTQTNDLTRIFWGDSGYKLYCHDATADTVYQYNLTTAYDLSTASYSNYSFNLTGLSGIAFNETGTKMYAITCGNNTYLYYRAARYSLSTPWSFQSVASDSTNDDMYTYETIAATDNVSVKTYNGGRTLFIGDSDDRGCAVFDLSTPYDLLTANGAYSTSDYQYGTGAGGLAIRNDVIGMITASATSDFVYFHQYRRYVPSSVFPTRRWEKYNLLR